MGGVLLTPKGVDHVHETFQLDLMVSGKEDL